LGHKMTQKMTIKLYSLPKVCFLSVKVICCYVLGNSSSYHSDR
jgi:hypothetical protein